MPDSSKTIEACRMSSIETLELCDLPHSVLLHIFSFLKIQDLINVVRQTCKLWYSLSYDRFLWKHLDLDHIGDHLTDQTFLTLLESVCDHVERLDFGMAVHLTDASFMHKDMLCSHLKSINFSLTTVSNASIAFVAEKYPNLESIEINDCSYINIYQCLNYLSTLKKLKSVSFDDFGCNAEPSKLNERLKELFSLCPLLETIVIDSEDLSDEALSCLFENCPNIQSIVLAHGLCLSEEAFACIKGKPTKLVNIGLAYTPVEDRVLKIIAESSPNLKELDITGCIHITDIGIGHVAENCPNLEKLIGNRLHHEGGCNITNVGLSLIASGCPNLKTLDVNFCAGVTDIGITAVAEHCPQLTEIRLSGCVGITDNAVIALAENCPGLNHVNLTECVQVTSKSINLLMAKCRWLNTLSLETCHYLAKINLDEFLGARNDNSALECDQSARSETCTEEKVHKDDEDSQPNFGSNKGACAAEPAKEECLQVRVEDETPKSSSSGQSKSRPSVQTFSTIGSSLCMDFNNDGSFSFAVPQMLPYADEPEVRSQRNSACDLDLDHAGTSDSYKQDSDEEEGQLAEVAYVNRYMPHPNHCHLTSIHLSFCSKIANDSIRQLAKHCPDLMYISLRGCYLITDTAVEVLVKSCHNLHFLDISGGSAIQSMKLTNGSLIAIANYSKALKSLMICRNKLITLNGMQRVLRDCSSLIGVWVTVGDKLKITFSGILELVKEIDDRYVKITNTSQVEANGRQGNLCISLIPKKTPRVRLLNV